MTAVGLINVTSGPGLPSPSLLLIPLFVQYALFTSLALGWGPTPSSQAPKGGLLAGRRQGHCRAKDSPWPFCGALLGSCNLSLTGTGSSLTTTPESSCRTRPVPEELLAACPSRHARARG
jgi:hypothetical protein